VAVPGSPTCQLRSVLGTTTSAFPNNEIIGVAFQSARTEPTGEAQYWVPSMTGRFMVEFDPVMTDSSTPRQKPNSNSAGAAVKQPRAAAVSSQRSMFPEKPAAFVRCLGKNAELARTRSRHPTASHTGPVATSAPKAGEAATVPPSITGLAITDHCERRQ